MPTLKHRLLTRLRRKRPDQYRKLQSERLELRQLLASDFTNAQIPMDVSADGFVTPIDALQVINDLNSNGSRQLEPPTEPVEEFIDTNGDGFLSPIDALLVINVLNSDDEPPEISAALANDTAPGGTNDDSITFDPTIRGTVLDGTGVNRLEVMLDGGDAQDVEFSFSTGEFTFSPNLATDGSVDGQHTLQFRATDALNRTSNAFNLIFELDTTAPAINVELAAESDTGVEGDQLTTLDIVSLSGSTDPNTTVQVPSRNATAQSDAGGNFTLEQISLSPGLNTLQLQATDIAGNAADVSKRFLQSDSETAFALIENNEAAVEVSQVVDLGTPDDPRQLRITFTQSLDPFNGQTDVEDALNIYLVETANPSRTLLDGGVAGQPIFSRNATGNELTPGITSFQGNELIIDAASVAGNDGTLLFQLLTADLDAASLALIESVVSEPAIETGVTFPDQPQNAVLPGPAIDLSEFAPNPQIEIQVSDTAFDSGSGRFAAQVQVVNRGAAIGRNLILTLPGLPTGVALDNAAGSFEGSPYLNLAPAIPSGGLATGQASAPVSISATNLENLRFVLDLQAFTGGANRAPVLDSIESIETLPGDVIKRQLIATDDDGDELTFSLLQLNDLQNGPDIRLSSQGLLTVRPEPADIGSFNYQVQVTDGAEVVTETFSLTVSEDSITTTRISGTVLDTNKNPIPGITINIGSTAVLTDTAGFFLLEEPPEGFDADTLDIHGEEFVGEFVFPFVAEKLPLLFEGGRDLIPNVNNFIDRPIYLPALDVAGGTTIDPATDVTVSQEIAPGDIAEVFVKADTLRDQQGNDFTGVLSITEVPRNLTPAALPPGVFPGTVVTIQPGEMSFLEPAPLTLPNRGGFAPGTEMELFSINPTTGQFDSVGLGRVTNDARSIETVEGGIRNSSWHYFRPATAEDFQNLLRQQAKNLAIQEDNCLRCEALARRLKDRSDAPSNPTSETASTGNAPFAPPSHAGGSQIRDDFQFQVKSFATSEMELHSGALREQHNLVSYRSLGTDRGLSLQYNSQRADIRPIVHFGVDRANGDFLVAKASVRRGAAAFDVPGVAEGVLGLSGGQHLFRVPDGNQDINAAIQFDLQDQPSGTYEVEVSFGVRQLGGDELIGVDGQTTSTVSVINSSNSPFGAGWNLAGLQEIFENPDGSIFLFDAGSEELQFEAPAADGETFQSPVGDFSLLERLSDGTYRRTLTNQTVFQFNSDNRLQSVTDRNGNQTNYTYDTDGFVTSIIDPVGLETRFTRDGDRISKITDPANRETLLAYDDAGNLIRITDPDDSSRQFSYDQRHNLTSEIDKRGFREFATYGFHGRVTEVLRKDGTRSQFEALQTVGLFPADLTTRFDTAPMLGEANNEGTATAADPNGNVVETQLDKAGQIRSQSDAEGDLPAVIRDADNNPIVSFDGRGNSTVREFDDRGNITRTALQLFDRTTTIFAGSHYNIGHSTERVKFADLDGDGDLDAVATNERRGDSSLPPLADTITVMENDGNGVLSVSGTFTTDLTRTQDLQLADINGDGALDVLATGQEGFSSLLGNGDLSFQNFAFISLPDDVRKFDVGDLDGDNDIDVAVATENIGGDDLVLLIGDGSGAFATQNVDVGTSALDVAIADFDQDGNNDIAVGTIRDIRLLRGNGAGEFTAPAVASFVTANYFSIQAADLNRDGIPDLAAGSRGFVHSLVNFGDGSFERQNGILTGQDTAVVSDIAAVDLNGDAFPEILLSIDARPSGPLVFENLGLGQFRTESSTQYFTGADTAGIDLGDLDGDGDFDIIAANGQSSRSNGGLTILEGFADGRFNQVLAPTEGSDENLASELLDVTGDHLVDLITIVDSNNAAGDTAVSIRPGDGTGKFAVEQRVPLGLQNPIDVTSGDYNADGLIDLAVVDRSTARVAVLFQLDDKTFAEPQLITTSGTGSSIESADIDADGVDDIIATLQGPRRVFVLNSSGDGTFATTEIEADFTGRGDDTMQLIDLNNDGHLDVIGITPNRFFASDNSIAVFGNGDGTFSNPSEFGALIDTRAVSSADLNGDGLADIVVVGKGVSVRLGQEGGGFADAQTDVFPVDAAALGLEIQDVTQDGIPDLLMLLDDENHLLVLAGLGDGSFDELGRFAVGENLTSLSVSDLDLDGDLDVIVTDASLGTLSLTNQSQSDCTSGSCDERFEYDADFSQLTRMVDQLGRQTLFEIDPVTGNTLSETIVFGLPDATSGENDDLVTRMTYTDQGLLETVTDPLGRIDRFTYDSNGRQTAITFAVGTDDEASLQFEFDAIGNVVAEIDEAGNRTEFEFDALNRITLIRDAIGGVQRFSYDENGNLVEEIDQLNQVMRFSYDNMNRRTEQTDDVGNSTNFSYDAFGNLLSLTDRLGRQTRFAYDARNRLIETVDPDGTSRKIEYDADGNEIASIDRNGNTTRAVYDQRTLRTAMVDALGGQLIVDFDAVGNLVGMTDELGRSTAITFDEANRQIRTVEPDPDREGPDAAPITENVYDKAGNLIATIDPLGNTTQFTYDSRNRLVQQVDADPDGDGPLSSPSTAFAYDDRSLVVSTTDPLGDVLRYEYDALNRLTREVFPDPDGSGPQQAPVLTNAYNAVGRVIEQVDALGNRTTYAYDSLNRLIQENEADPDGDGPLTQPITTKSYDAEGQLVSVTDPLGRTVQSEYDALGRVVKIISPAIEIDSVSSSPIQQFAFDSNGNLIESTDPQGNITRYEYDALDRMIRVVDADPDGDGVLGSPVTTLTYDAAGQQISETDPLGRTSHFVYDDLGRLIENISPDPDSDGPALTPVTRYEYDLIGNTTAIIDALGNSTQFIYDNLYREILQVDADPDGDGPLLSPTFASSYDATGNLVSSTDPLGRITTFEYDSLDRVIKQTDPDPDQDGPLSSPVTLFRYDAMSNIVASVDPLGQETIFEYDGLLRQIRVTDADPDGDGPLESPVTQFEYDVAGQTTAMIDPLNRSTRFEYDALGRQTRLIQEDPDGAGPLTSPITTNVYDLTGNLIRSIDANENTTQFEYDGLNRVIRQVDADPDADGPLEAPVSTFEYDAAGQLTQSSDPLNRTTRFAYDNLGRLIRIEEPDPDRDGPATRRTTTMQYDLVGNITSETDALGNATQFEYDNLYRQVRTVQTDPDGAGPLSSPSVEFQYDVASNLIASTDQLGRVTLSQYDDLDREIARIAPDPDGAGPQAAPVTNYVFDADNNLLEIVDSLGNSTIFEYDNLDRQIRMIEADPDGAGPQQSPVISTTYDVAGQTILETDSLGRETSFAYDQLGRLIAVTAADPDGAGSQESPVTRFAYDAFGNTLAITDSNGNTTQFEYDGLNRQIRRVDADPDGEGALESPVTRFVFDVASQLTQVIDPLGRATQFEYDDLGRETKRLDPDPDANGPATSPSKSTEYDLFGNVLSVTNALGHTTSFTYDDLYRRTITTDANGDQTVYAFDAFGNQVSLTDAIGNATTFEYDGLNRVTRETNELGNARIFEYDTEGNLLRKTDRNGRVIENEYDNLYRRLQEKWLEGNSQIREFNYSYDTEDQLLAVSDPSATYTFEYDNLGRTTRTVQNLDGLSPTVAMERAFDGENNLLSTSTTLGGTQDTINEYQYDALNRRTSLRQSSAGGNAVADKLINYSYDAASQVDSIRRFNDADGTQVVATSSYGFDLAGRLISLNHRKDGNELASYQWTFDAGNRITQATNSFEGTSSFTHDDRGQLTAASHDSQSDEAFEYDANGNRIGGSNSIGENNRLLSDGTFNYEYDDEGNRTKRTNISTGEVNEYEWDHRNRLILATDRDSAGGPATKTIRFQYDAFNRWTSEHVDADGDGAAGETDRFYVNDNGQIVLDFEGTEAEDLSHRYLWGNKIDQLLADEIVGSLSTAGEVLWPLGDDLGTIRDLATYDVASDQTTVANHRTYDSFGNLTAESDAAVDSLFGFTGRPFDEDSGLQNNWNRWYDPNTGRWTSEDPIGFAGGDANLNRYVGNGPLTATDPDGLRAISNLPFGTSSGPDFSSLSEPGKTVRRSRLNDIVGDTAAGLIDSADDFVTETATGIASLPGAAYNGAVSLTEAWFIEVYRSFLTISDDPIDKATYRELADKGSDAMLARGVRSLAKGIYNLPGNVLRELGNRLDDYNALIGAGCQRQATKIFGDTVIDAAEAAFIAKTIGKALAKGKGVSKGKSKPNTDGPDPAGKSSKGPEPSSPKPEAPNGNTNGGTKNKANKDPNKQRQEIPQQGKRGDAVRKRQKQERTKRRQDPNHERKELEVQGKSGERLKKRKQKEAEAKAKAKAEADAKAKAEAEARRKAEQKKKLSKQGRFSQDDIVKNKPELKKQLEDARKNEALEKQRRFEEVRQRQIDDARRQQAEIRDSERQSERFEEAAANNDDLLKKDADTEFKKDDSGGGSIDDFFAAFE